MTEQNRQEHSTFDFIIIGGGTAGCVLAARLSERLPHLSVLVLEAGEDRTQDERVYTPGLCGKLLHNDEFDWQYSTTPEVGLNNRKIKHPRGKLLGGSSAINSFALIYPNRAGIDVWESLGNKGWDWNGLAKYFRRFNTICKPSAAFEGSDGLPVVSPPNNQAGPIQASLPTNLNALQHAWVESFRELHLENTTDPLDGDALGGYISHCHITGDTRERSHAGVAYLPQETRRKRSNLHVVTNALVEKIEFSNKTQTSQAARALGVHYRQDGKMKYAHVRQEVILAAGAFASPQILEVSGVGNPELLSKYGIEVIHANKHVGENLQDHIRAAVSFEATQETDSDPPVDEPEARRLYEESRTGPWAEFAVWSFSYLPLAPFLSKEDKEALQNLWEKGAKAESKFEQMRNNYVRDMVLSPTEATTTTFLSRRRGDFDPSAPAPPTLPAASPTSPSSPESKPIGINSMLSHPLSRGSVHITSRDISVKPLINFNYYSHPLDLEVHALSLHKATSALSKAGPLSSHILPGGRFLPENRSLASLEDCKAICKQYSGTNYHPCGTCSMMAEDLGGVVDHQLKVYGLENVRVVDASVLPIIPRGNIITAVYAVAEKAADLICEGYAR